MMERRVCKRCLLRELAGTDQASEAKLRMIEKYRDAIGPNGRAGEEAYERRLAVCRECERLVDGTCLACGCYVELRAAAKGSRCPKKKW